MTHIKSMRLLTDAMDFYKHKPSNHLLENRNVNEAYCLAIEGAEYVVYFPENGNVKLNALAGKYEVKWLNILSSQWSLPKMIKLPGKVKTPSDEQWAIFIRMID